MAQLKITADTKGVKKSLLDLGKSVKSMGATKVSVFTEQDRKFIKNELNRELSNMKTKLKENQVEIGKLLKEQNKLTKDSKEELAARKQIVEAYRQQTKLAKDMEAVQSQKKTAGFGGKMGGRGGIMGMLGKGLGLALGAVGGAAVAGVLYGGARTMQAGDQYREGAKNRVRLKGLGVHDDNFGSPKELAEAGLSEQDIIDRQIQATSRLGRQGTSKDSIMKQARFERSMGLEGGTMTNVASSMRSQFGGKGADVAQQKLQASILAAGIEDALGPYLESATDLLSSINENGVTNTDEITKMFAQMAKDGNRTPEQLATAFKGLDQAVRGSKGESNAFMQAAFARGGIGGGKIGGTRLAIESGGIFGLDENALAGRGYNPELIKNMKKSGFTSGLGERSGAILNQYKSTAGVKGSIEDVTDVDTMTRLTHLGNASMGTQGMGGFDALKMMERVQSGKMSQDDFSKKMDEMQSKSDPTLDRLTRINTSLAGVTTILQDIRTNTMEGLGKNGGAQIKNVLTELDTQGIKGTANTVGALNDTNMFDASRKAIKGTGDYALEGHAADLPEQIGNAMSRFWDKIKPSQVNNPGSIGLRNNINIKIQNSDGKVQNKTHK